ncbi:hypothetical protein RN001_011838 [Aquatica leii]|uniref:Myb/SANT-like DNA-binding domain-containing protein n=1 Tax=Aquatica leii TaxID=1421715 RepID=A0AAN7S7J9_9COLE|nr:hypothetical protein RN001_011838 [Aquatica leii]
MSWLVPVVDKNGKVLFNDDVNIFIYNEATKTVSYVDDTDEHRNLLNIPITNTDINTEESGVEPDELQTDLEESDQVKSQTDSAGESDASKHKWTHDAILLLLALYDEKLSEFQSAHKCNKTVWNSIARSMKSKYSMVTSEQCDVKFRNLKKTYKRIKDNNHQSGAGAITWPYFDTFDLWFRNNAAIQPIALASNINGYVSSNSRSSPASEESRSDTPTSSRQSRKRSHSALNEEPTWMVQFRQEAAKRHAEKMSLLKELIGVLKEK